MRALVTGTAGFIASHLAKRLLDEGHEVVGVDNFAPSYDPSLKRYRLDRLRPLKGFRFLEIDLARKGAIDEAFSDRPDVVFHLGARAGVRQSVDDPWVYLDANATGTLNVLEAARRRDVRRVFLASTSSAYGSTTQSPFREDAPADRPLSPYAASKRAAELMAASYVHLYGLDVPVARFFTVYGPAGRPDMSVFRFIEWMMRGEPIIVNGDGRQTRDFTHVSDIVDGVLRAVEKTRGFDLINLGSDRPVALNDVIALIEKELGVVAAVTRRPLPAADVLGTHADITKARTHLGWEPMTSLEDGLRDAVAWHRLDRSWLSKIDLGPA